MSKSLLLANLKAQTFKKKIKWCETFTILTKDKQKYTELGKEVNLIKDMKLIYFSFEKFYKPILKLNKPVYFFQIEE